MRRPYLETPSEELKKKHEEARGNILTASIEEADAYESAEILEAISNLDNDDLSVVSCEYFTIEDK